MGLVLIKTAREFEAPAMLMINLVQGFFLIILIKASPFEVLPQIPPDGAGLNPLLQNPWMVIHPPVLFIGYAAAAFPFALAVAALVLRQYKAFVPRALPWTLFTSLTLGAGIIIGGYWAYKVLGWGGYWGWDPVENSSLVPWLTMLALFHGLIVQKIKGALAKTNLFLAIVSFALVLYATFLTRSGVLADFSVHSFQDLGINLFLIAFILTVLGIGLFLLFKKYGEIPYVALELTSLNREMILLASLFVFAASAFFTFMGTSSPIFTGLLGRPSQVNIQFYNKIHLPIAILMGLLLGLAPFLRWRGNGLNSVLKSILPSLILTGVSTAVPFYLGMSNPLHLLFITSGAFAFWSNLIVSVRLLKTGWQHTGAPLAHVGVALLLIGIIVSTTFEEKQKIVLDQNVSGKVFDYQMVYKGMTPAANGKDRMNIEVREGRSNYTAEPRFYQSQYNQSVMTEPDVNSTLLYDLYISPLQRKPSTAQSPGTQSLLLTKGERKQLGEYEIYFKGFDMNDHGEGGSLRAGACLEISNGTENFSVVPAIIFDQNEYRTEPATFSKTTKNLNKQATVIVNKIDADQKAVELVFEGIGRETESVSVTPEQVVLDVSKKPFMNVLWLGTILITAGTLIAIRRRIPEPLRGTN
ncbi:MAG: cytochrome c biogenesis protein CcsA [Calditrichia bacterium]|nr:cytochrome c biogenesis protein CcsA [Calditrichia bacterium]